MIKCNDWPIGICSWSLNNDFDKLAAIRDQTQIEHLHLAIEPALGQDGDNYLSRVQKDGWNVTATMIGFPQEDYSTMASIRATGGIVLDQYWEQNRKKIFDAIDVTAQLGTEYITLHLGFINPQDPDQFKKLLERTKILADRALEKNISLLLETGQETAEDLRQFLQQADHPALKVNFDPANMVLYNKGNPIEAVQTLAPWIRHVHIKDAIRSKDPGHWGQEVVWGTGEVDDTKFINALKQIGFTGALAIEREAGEKRLNDIRVAVEKLCSYIS